MIRTLSGIERRCAISGRHWLWPGAMAAGTTPAIWHRGRVVSVRRLVMEMRDGAPPAAGIKALADCEHPNCVSPHCTVGATQAEQCARTAARRSPILQQLSNQRVAISMRAHSRLSQADAHRLRTSSEPVADMAAELGIDLSYAYDVRNNTARRDLTTTHWAGLPAQP